MTADMRRQIAARGNEDLGLARPPVENSQKLMLPRVRTKLRKTTFLIPLNIRYRHAYASRKNRDAVRPGWRNRENHKP